MTITGHGEKPRLWSVCGVGLTQFGKAVRVDIDASRGGDAGTAGVFTGSGVAVWWFGATRACFSTGSVSRPSAGATASLLSATHGQSPVPAVHLQIGVEGGRL
jgi:hypothetical protein